LIFKESSPKITKCDLRAGSVFQVLALRVPAEWSQAELVQLCQGRSKGYLKQDSLLKDRTNIYDEKGHRKGYLKEDNLLKGRKNIYDRTGDRKGYLKEDTLLNDKTIIYKD
jgi:hypothetical protein